VPRLWHGRFRGQEQKWFAFRFTGKESDIDIAQHRNPEFSAWRWVETRLLPELIVPFKRQLYLELIDEFRYLLQA
jgi:putative (di)nucleoside polyphosphate hydrolase